MKSSKELKKELHEYIDRIDDDETLWMVHEDVSTYLKHDVEDDELTEEQKLQLEEAIRQADAGETMSLDEFKKKMFTWHSK